MAHSCPHELPLSGCTPEPLMAYLKALGILRLVSEQKDPQARGWWKNDLFYLRSGLDREALLRFFLEEYRPTPIVAPWAGGSGFFQNDNQDALQALAQSQVPRMESYRKVIRQVPKILQEENLVEKPEKAEKNALIRRYRSELPDEVVAWMDVAMVLQEADLRFAPLLGTGGNDGRLNFTKISWNALSCSNYTRTNLPPKSQNNGWNMPCFPSRQNWNGKVWASLLLAG